MQLKNDNALGKVSSLVYKLLSEGKMQLLETVIVSLKKEEEKIMEKNNKVDSSNNNTKCQLFVSHSALLNYINLSHYIQYTGGKFISHSNN